MNLLEPRSEGELTPNDVVGMLIAVVRAYGMQEANGKGSKVIVDTHDLAFAKQLLLQGNVHISKISPDVLLKDRPVAELDLIRFVIEVRE